MRRIRLLLICALILSSFVSAAYADPSNGERFGKIWKRAYEKLEKTVEMVNRQETLPERRRILNDRQKNSRKIDKVLTEVIDILTDSEANDIRLEVASLNGDIEKLHRKISDLKIKRIAAPEEGSLLKTSRKDIDEKIDTLETKISDLDKRIENCRRKLSDALERCGLRTSPDQIDILLASVSGDDIVSMYGVYENIRRFASQLMELMEEAPEDIDASRRYYGVYAVLLRTCIVMDDTFIGRVDGDHIPGLDAISERSRRTLAQTREQLKDRSLAPQLRKQLSNNARTNERTIETAALYRKYLQEQRDRIAESRRGLQKVLNVAMNTYQTVRNATDLLSVVRTSQREIDILTRLEMPEMTLSGDDALRAEFEAISRKLQQR